jgi:hypothetical protein
VCGLIPHNTHPTKADGTCAHRDWQGWTGGRALEGHPLLHQIGKVGEAVRFDAALAAVLQQLIFGVEEIGDRSRL